MRHDREISAAFEQRLLAELNRAREAFERAGVRGDRTISENYSAAIKRFSEFILEGILPTGYTNPPPRAPYRE
jgi:hypothetical protein